MFEAIHQPGQQSLLGWAHVGPWSTVAAWTYAFVHTVGNARLSGGSKPAAPAEFGLTIMNSTLGSASPQLYFRAGADVYLSSGVRSVPQFEVGRR